MWHFISDQISEQTGVDFICDDIREVSNGDTHKAYKISDGKKRYFVKLNDRFALANFESEAEGLQHLADTELFRVPDVICVGSTSEKAFLVLEHISMTDGDRDAWRTCGVQLATMHQSFTQEMYGWQDDNFIGATSQHNNWQKRWPQFFAEQRIGFLLQLLEEKGTHLVNIDNAVEGVKALLAGHQPAASMLHGDLWHGNVGFHNGQPVLFDPAFYYGDREAEIAMTELFTHFPTAFYDGYNDTWPLDDGYAYRKSVYQLYHILNHALMFGGHYIESATSILKNLDN